jgi:maltose alpha-D-glucosyltransferase / alpha-amylase
MKRHVPLDRDPLWYKDAVIYELHVRSFFDANNDGVGDFPGLIRRLDYIQDLGVTCIWLLPFYPSPLKDDGYDISAYNGVNPAYGTLRDFKVFLREAHYRGLRVFTELVVNHTSDQHPWFQAARRAPRGSVKRDYYVWSDTGEEYSGTRIIFTDTETSNWTWDPVAKGYYWHRFFSHQPDLNFDNPHVLKAIIKVMRFWFDMGVDGLRLDAVPYLIEREGTNCENLAETHAILKTLRAEVDARYEARTLLAEANQWPADVRPYFGDGDECHMAYHFPLMPRIFMAVRQEDALPITEILRQTPEIPDNAQWALFLRNHDEMTLEMVTDEERDYLYTAYAADPQMRLNVGIRRRLAPLMEYSRARVELLNSLLLSLPGSPIIYYGDELGMGDNIYLGDRNGVRTPMQWTGDRNAGFSRADPARLFAPPVMDPLYGYQAINVEAQERSPSSLLNWMRTMIGLRKRYRTFGRGRFESVATDNRRVLAYTREDDEHQILVVANMAHTVQPVSLDLSRFLGLTPVEMIGTTSLPAIGETSYFLTLGPHAFYWFLLTRPDEAAGAAPPSGDGARAQAPPLALLASAVWDQLLDDHLRRLLERDALPLFLPRQRWFGAKARRIVSTRIADWTTLVRGSLPVFLALVDVALDDGRTSQYVVPMATAAGEDMARVIATRPNAVVARISGARSGVLYDGMTEPSVCQLLQDALWRGADLPLRHGRLSFHHTPSGAVRISEAGDQVRALVPAVEQSNSNIMLGDRFLLKLFRRLEPGENPDIEVGRALGTQAREARVPELCGWVDYHPADGPARSVAMLQELVPSRGAVWERALDELQLFYERALVASRGIGNGRHPDPADEERMADAVGAYWTSIFLLGRRTADLHRALAGVSDETFRPVPFDEGAVAALEGAMHEQAGRILERLSYEIGPLVGPAEAKAVRLLSVRTRLEDRLRAPAAPAALGLRMRTHGDYHMGQVLDVEGDFYIIDFEGEPSRSIEERRQRQSPLRDVGGMLRSFSYAAQAGLRQFLHTHPGNEDLLQPWARAWDQWIGEVYLRAYLTAMAGSGLLPDDEAVSRGMVATFVLDKAIYELGYELDHRPDWVDIPLNTLLWAVDPGWTPPPVPNEGQAHG